MVLPCLPTATHRLKCRLQNTKESAAGETIGEEIAEAIAAPFDDTVRLLPMSPQVVSPPMFPRETNTAALSNGTTRSALSDAYLSVR